MRSLNLILILFLLTFFSCQRNHDLRGHWHIYPIGESSLIQDGYEVMEIKNDSMASFGQSVHGYYGFGGGIEDRIWHKRLRFGGECMVLEFDFKLSKDTLHLFQVDYNLETDREVYGSFYKGFRCGESCCSKEIDMLQSLKIDIRLPIVQDTNHLIVNDFNNRFDQNIFYGFSKKKYQILYGKRPVISLGYSISSPEDIPIYNEKVKIKLREETHSLIRIVIYADKQTDLESIIIAMKKYKNLGYKKVFFALKSKSLHKNFKIWLKPFDLSKLENLNKSKDFITIEKWLQSN